MFTSIAIIGYEAFFDYALLPVGLMLGLLMERASLRIGLEKFLGCETSALRGLRDCMMKSILAEVIIQQVLTVGSLSHLRLILPWKLFLSLLTLHTTKISSAESPTVRIDEILLLTLRGVFVTIGIALGSAFQPVGLTGGIACGKSTVVNILAEKLSNQQRRHTDKSLAIIDLDKIARDVVNPMYKPTSYYKIVAKFGNDILVDDCDSKKNSSGTINYKHKKKIKPIDRRKLGNIIFQCPSKRRILNKLVHPLITRVMLWKIVQHHFCRNGALPVSADTMPTLVDIPLLFESGKLLLLFGTIVVVATTPEIQLDRLAKRNPDLTRDQCQDRITSQFPMEKKVERADVVIWNNGTVSDLQRHVDAALEAINSRHGHWGRRFGLSSWIWMVILPNLARNFLMEGMR